MGFDENLSKDFSKFLIEKRKNNTKILHTRSKIIIMLNMMLFAASLIKPSDEINSV